MKIALATGSLHPGSFTRGIGTYARELGSAFQKKYPENKIITNSTDPYRSAADLVHYPFFDLFSHTLPLSQSKPTVITIHDVIPLKYPPHFPVGIRGRLSHFLQRLALKRVSHIITDSLASKADITKYLRVKPEKVTVVPLAPSSTRGNFRLSSKVKKDYGLPDQFLLYVGDINWNKNLPALITALSAQSSSVHLVCVGKVFRDKPDIPEYHAVTKAIKDHDLSSRVHLLGYVPSHHLPLIYRLATLYVQPSWDEGFGLPVLEAMRLGTPVLSSNRGSLPEVGGDAVYYFDPGVTGDLSAKLKKLLSKEGNLSALIEKGMAHANTYSWDRVAKETLAVYKHALSQL